MEKKLVYILNSYSENTATHFKHIIHLLEVMANRGVKICLVIEKLEGEVYISNKNIQVNALKSKNTFKRQIELFLLILKLKKQGYNKCFIRISSWATIIASLAHFLKDNSTFLWQSGTTHEYDWEQPFGIKKIKWMIKSAFPNWLARKLVSCFVTGPEYMVSYYEKVVRIKKDKIRLLYNDIDLSRFNTTNFPNSRQDLLDQYGLEPSTKILLLVHRLSPVRKTLMYLEPFLQSMVSVDYKWFLIVAGGGEELGKAKKMVVNLGLERQVFFLGNVANSQIMSLYAGADYFIQPSYTEGFPRVLIEAMASGLPIITTDAGGTSQLMGEKQSEFIVSKSEPNLFAKKALELFSLDNNQIELLKNENLTVVKKFSTENVVDMYIKVIFSDE